MLEILGSAVSGGLTGLVGSTIGKGFSWLEQKEERKAVAKEYEHELALLERQSAVRLAQSEQEHDQDLDMAMEANSTQFRLASYAHDSGLGEAHQWVISVLRLIRPSLTFLLVGAACWLVMRMGDASVAQQMASEVIYMASTAVSWWFGDRAPGRQNDK